MSYISAREIYRKVTNKRRRVMGDLFDRILGEVYTCAENPGVEGDNTPGQLPSG